MSVIDKASLIQIPSGYKEDKLYSVKPTDGSGDFNFTRASSATRVNSDGFIETASVVSATEDVTNGDFATDSNWTKGSGWSIANGLLNGVNATSSTYQNNGLVSGKFYKVVYEVSNYSSGTVQIKLGGTLGEARNQNGTYTEYIEATQVITWILGTNFYGSIDNLSVKELLENDVPRIDYTGGGCGKLLLEPQRTNLITQSEDFSNAYWSKSSITVTDGFTSPSGNLDATLLKGSTNSSVHNVVRAGLSASNTAALSIFAKAKELRYLQIASANTPNQCVNFDLQDGLIGTVGSSFSNAKIENYGNGWYKCSVTSINQYNGMYISLVSSLTSSWLESWTMSNNTDGLFIYGAQLEQGSYPTSYIPTSGATATRTRDETRTTGLGSVLLSEEGTFYAELKTFADTGNGRLSLSDGNYYNNAINIAFDTVNSQLDIRIVSQTATVLITSVTLANIFEVKKVAIRYKTNDFSVWVDGIKVHEVLSGNSFTANTLSVLSNDWGSNSSFPFYGEISSIMNTSYLTDLEIESLTSFSSFAEMANALNYTVI